MRAALLLLALGACGAGVAVKDTKVAATDELSIAVSDVARMTELLRNGVVNGGLWFDDASCASKFDPGEIAPTARAELARCLVGLKLQRSARQDALGDVVVMTYAPGFEVEVRMLTELGSKPALTWIGFASRRSKDTAPSITGDALESLRIAGDRNGPIEPALGDTFEREPAPQDDTGATSGKFAMTWLKVCLDEGGAVTDVEPFLTTSTKAEAGFVAAARAWKFRPFTIGGQPIPVCAMARLVYPPTVAAGPETLPMPPAPSRSKKRPLVLASSRLIEGYRIAGSTNIVPPDLARTEIARHRIPEVRGTFRICLDDTGVPESVLPMRSTGFASYDQRIIGQMRTWRYRPYQVDDQTVPVCTAVTFVYRQH